MNVGYQEVRNLSFSQQNSSLLWMKGGMFDLFFFHISGLVCLFLLIPYVLHGESVVFPIYNLYLVFFGLPHNYLTWATLLPKSARNTFKLEPVIIAGLVCLVITLLIPYTEGTDFNDWILSFISYYSLWHAYRQHHGLCKVYDSIQSKRTGDVTIFKDRRAMNLFFGFAANGIVVWAFTHKNIKYLLSADQFFNLIHPEVPQSVFQIYVVATLFFGVWAVKETIWDRWTAGRFIPWPQISLMGIALATYIIPYFFIPIEAMPLAVAIGTIFHNIQYFGFVWLFERERSKDLMELKVPLQLPQKLSYEGAWVKYFSIALLYSFIVVGFYLCTPNRIGLTFIYFLGISHYIIDGYIWRRDCNTLLGSVIHRLSKFSVSNELKTAS